MKVTVQSKQIQFVGEQLIPPLFYGNTHVLSNWEFLQLYGEFKTLENIGYRISLKLALWEAHRSQLLKNWLGVLLRVLLSSAWVDWLLDSWQWAGKMKSMKETQQCAADLNFDIELQP